MNKIIIGLGTGRCGTNTFMRLLRDNGINATHEDYYLSWDFNKHEFQYAVNSLKKRNGKVSDTAFYWINYVSPFLNIFPQTKFVCLKRNKEKVVASFNHRTPNYNWWTDPQSKYWDNKWIYSNRIRMMPKYDLPKIEALGKYYDDYYLMAEKYENKYPDNFKIYNTDDVLNNEDCQKEMFDFVGIIKPKIFIGRKYNEKFTSNIEVEKKTYYGNHHCFVCGDPATHDIHNVSFSFLVRACDNCVDKESQKIKGQYLNEQGEFMEGLWL